MSTDQELIPVIVNGDRDWWINGTRFTRGDVVRLSEGMAAELIACGIMRPIA